MKHIKNLDQVSEGKYLDDKSTIFSGKPNVSISVEEHAGTLSVWINGGNAFRFIVPKESLANLTGHASGHKQTELGDKIMELVARTLDENIVKLIGEIK